MFIGNFMCPTRDYNSTLPLSQLQPKKVQIARTLLTTLLDLDTTVQTFAQIIDGLPTHQNALHIDPNFSHPNVTPDRTSPSPESVEKFKAFRDELQWNRLMLDAKILQKYNDASPSSESELFSISLIEILGFVIHNLAVNIFMEHHNLADAGDTPEAVGRITLYHPGYMRWREYPRGANELVGYWAETVILGGVVSLDRGLSHNESNGIFINPLSSVGEQFKLSNRQLRRFNDIAQGDPKSLAEELAKMLPWQPDVFRFGASHISVA